MIFAAGFGTRMKHLTRKQPKPMIPVAGRPLIDHALDLVQELAPKRIVANTHYLPEPLKHRLIPKGVLISEEAEQILDTGGGLRQALPLLGPDPVFTVNPDVIWQGPNPLAIAAAAWQPDHMDALLVCVPIGQTRGRSGSGDFTADGQGRISRGGDLVYGGVQILKTDRLQEIPETCFSLNVLWNMLRDESRLYSVTYPGQWCDVGTPEGVQLAEDMIANV